MSRLLKLFFVGLALAWCSGPAFAFSLLGPSLGNTPLTPWQTPDWGYNLAGDIGGPMYMAEEYRWNTPIVTYAYDPTFLETYGTNGVAAIESAIAILNALPPASQMDINQFALNTRHLNTTAQALQLSDLKSATLAMLLEQMGLARPERWVWTLRDRWLSGDAPDTFTNYYVIQMNYDPDTFNPTAYINGGAYTYATIFDNANGPAPHVFPVVQPVSPSYPNNRTSVAGYNLTPGEFYSGLTRDDAGGLRYLLHPNTLNWEQLLPDVKIVFTNFNMPLAIYTYDLALLNKNSQHTTNDPAQLLTLYPGLHLSKTNTYIDSEIKTNVYTYYTNYPCNPTPVWVTNYTTNAVQFYSYEFDNLITNSYSPSHDEIESAYEVLPPTNYFPGDIVFLQTNYWFGPVTNYGVDGISGDAYILPTNFFAGSDSNLLGFYYVSNMFTGVSSVTNVDFMVPGALATWTNRTTNYFFTTYDLEVFSQQARTNDAAALQALYPGLMVVSSQPHIGTETVTNYFEGFFLPDPWASPYGTLALTQQVSLRTNIVYEHRFGNVVTNFGLCAPIYGATYTVEQSLSAHIDPYNPAYAPFDTNLFESETVYSNTPSGSIYFVPTNWFGLDIQEIGTNTIWITNTYVYTNFDNGILQTNIVNVSRVAEQYMGYAYPIQFISTNDLASNQFGFRHEVITTVTTNVFQVCPIVAVTPTNSVGLRPGCDKITFRRVFLDPLYSTNFAIVTNDYIDTVLVPGPNTNIQQRVWRTSRQPDIIFNAADITLPAYNDPNHPAPSVRSTTANWINNQAINSQTVVGAGPGIIVPPIRITFTRATPFFYNYQNKDFFFLEEPTLANLLLFGIRDNTFGFGSFDGTTNAPIVYPVGQSAINLQNQLLNPPTP